MRKIKLPTTGVIIGIGIGVFVVIVSMIFFISYKLGQKTSVTPTQQLVDTSRQSDKVDQQIRRIKFTKTNGESMEILMDGTVNQYDKSGKLTKTRRRGFAETQNVLRQFEWLINNGKSIESKDYQIEIETQTGTITINPGTGGTGPGGSVIDDAIDFIDKTVNPTPTPKPATPPPGSQSTPHPSSQPSPTPLPTAPDYLSAPPFNCSDYYTTGKPLKISNTVCGPTSTP